MEMPSPHFLAQTVRTLDVVRVGRCRRGGISNWHPLILDVRLEDIVRFP